MCIYIHMKITVCVNVWNINIHKYECKYTHIYLFIYIYIKIFIYIYLYIFIYIYVYIYIYTFIYICKYIHIYTYMYIHIYTHVYLHNKGRNNTVHSYPQIPHNNPRDIYITHRPMHKTLYTHS
jgi:hypothetical protein